MSFEQKNNKNPLKKPFNFFIFVFWYFPFAIPQCYLANAHLMNMNNPNNNPNNNTVNQQQQLPK